MTQGIIIIYKTKCCGQLSIIALWSSGVQKTKLLVYSVQMHIKRISDMEDSNMESTNSTGIYLNLTSMTYEEIQKHFEMLDNFTLQQRPEDLDILKETHWRVFVILIYTIVIIFGFLENFVIVCVLIKNRRLHVSTHILILGLAMSDILCLFNLPFQLHYQLTDQWAFGGALCHVIMPTYGVPVFVSSMSILMIAIDRYMLIVHPFRQRMSCQTAVCLVISVTVLTILLAIPIIVQMEYQVIDLPALRIYRTYCTEMWQSIRLRHIYTVLTLLIQFFVPLIATSFLYIKISDVLSRRPIKKNEKRNKHKTNKILIAIVLLFSICWLPWNLFTLLLEFYPNLIPGRQIKLFDLLLKIFAMSSTCINPFMYSWLNDNFWKELRMVKRQVRQRIRQNRYHTYTLAQPMRTSSHCGEKYPTTIL